MIWYKFLIAAIVCLMICAFIGYRASNREARLRQIHKQDLYELKQDLSELLERVSDNEWQKSDRETTEPIKDVK